MRVGDGALWEVDVETEEMKIVHRFEFHWVAKEVVVNEGLDGRVVEEVFVVNDETVVNISIVCEVKVSVLKEIVVHLVPGMLNEGDGYVAYGIGLERAGIQSRPLGFVCKYCCKPGKCMC